MWIEWEKELINLNHVKQIYTGISIKNGNFWYLKLIVDDSKEEHVRYFDSKQEAEEQYEKIKKIVLHSCEFNFGIPC